MTEDVGQLNDGKKSIMWCAGALQQLVDWDLLEGPDRLTGKGHLLYYELIESGYKPSDDDIQYALNALRKNVGDGELKQNIFIWLKEFRDNPGKMKQFVKDNHNE